MSAGDAQAGDKPTTFHLTPQEDWTRQANDPTYTPDAYAQDGFVHCTDGEANVLAVGNLFYRGDPRPYVALVLDPARLTADVRYEDEDHRYPHVYGPIDREAVVAVRRVIRAGDGGFVGIE